MGWFCPTFQRPERLAELALSWERNAPGVPLHVRVWEKDPRKEDYFKYDWPDGWELYESKKEWAGEAFNEYFDWNPNEDFYGFIGDDTVLRTKNGLKALEITAGRMFMSYPNDTIHRHRLNPHYCLGGDTARALGFVTPRTFYHFNMDRAMQFITGNCGLQRYCPQVVLQHKHFLWELSERDATYRKVYGGIPLEKLDKFVPPDERIYKEWEREDGMNIVIDLRMKLLSQYENHDKWEEEDMQMMMEDGRVPVLCD